MSRGDVVALDDLVVQVGGAWVCCISTSSDLDGASLVAVGPEKQIFFATGPSS